MFSEPHKSHSRRDLIEIIKLFKLPIEDAEDYNKKDLIEKLVLAVNTIDNIIPDEYYFGIESVQELKEYLIKPNQKKVLSIKDKNDLMITAKLIISFCKGGYCVNISYFNSVDEIYSEARRISQFGDIPSIRRMCFMLNKNPNSNEMIYPIISKKVQRELEVKKLTSRKIHYSLSIIKGKHIVSFD